jgi:hypothetical protein
LKIQCMAIHRRLQSDYDLIKVWCAVGRHRFQTTLCESLNLMVYRYSNKYWYILFLVFYCDFCILQLKLFRPSLYTFH